MLPGKRQEAIDELPEAVRNFYFHKKSRIPLFQGANTYAIVAFWILALRLTLPFSLFTR